MRLEFHGVKVSSEAGLLVTRELDRVLSLAESAAAMLQDNRTGANIQHSKVALLRQAPAVSVFRNSTYAVFVL